MPKLSFGVITLQSQPWDVLVETWKQIESLGFDSAWVADHFLNYRMSTRPYFEAWTLLSGLAAVTEKIRVGTLVTAAPLRHPAMLARQALTTDHISNGRLNLGIGAGVAGALGETVYEMIGIDDWGPAERIARFREQIQILDNLLRERVSSYSGRYYRLKDVAMYPAPVQEPRPPITVGSIGPKTLKIAAEFADTWNTFGGRGLDREEMYDTVTTQSHLIDDYCKEFGRSPESLRRSVLVVGSDELMESDDTFSKYVDRYSDIGFEEFIVYYPFIDEKKKMFERIARDVIPSYRS
jgi:alkanesulfonate monooxygenase SsuD/methylene tetrahydromethanopterin reductase-like flavin-dependent oxidoreductase (luciferase family)